MRKRSRKNFERGYKGGLIIGRASFLFVGIALVFMLGVLYLSQLNSLAVKGASITDLENKRKELEEERDRLQVEAVRLQSIREVEKSLKESPDETEKYVPVDKINYLSPSNIAVK